MGLSIATQNLAITNGTGECPAGQATRIQIKPSVFLTSEGRSPLGCYSAQVSQAGKSGSIGLRAIFAGQEGETPLNFYVRSAL